MHKSKTYDLVSRVNHWLIAIAMIGMICAGLLLSFGDLAREQQSWLRNIHKATGVLILIAAAWRVGWRLVQGFPAPASVMPRWQSLAATAAHWLLLLVIVLMPLSGLISSVFGGRAVDVFSLFTIPAQTEIEWLSSFASNAHTYMGRFAAALVVIHIAGALKHHFITKDATLLRMLTGRTK